MQDHIEAFRTLSDACWEAAHGFDYVTKTERTILRREILEDFARIFKAAANKLEETPRIM